MPSAAKAVQDVTKRRSSKKPVEASTKVKAASAPEPTARPAPTPVAKAAAPRPSADELPTPLLDSATKPYSQAFLQAIFKPFMRDAEDDRFRCLVTPKMGEKLIKTNAGNRKLRAGHVTDLARNLRMGEWKENGDSLKFDTEGRMLDGQHRVMAGIEADLPFQTDIVLNLDPASQLTMDGGLKRSVGDALAMRGEKYANNIPAMMRWLFWLVDERRNYRTTSPEMIKLLDRYPQLRDSVRIGQNSGKWKGTHTSIITTIHFLATNFMDQGDRADAFVQVWITGVPNYINDPAHRVRERVLNQRIMGKQYTPQKLCDMIVLAYNYFVDRKAPRQLLDPKDGVKLKGLDVSRIDLT